MSIIDTPITTNDASFQRVLANPLPVIVVLWSGTLDSRVGEVLYELAREEAYKLLVARLRADENPKAAQYFAYDGTPVAIGWKSGEEKTRLMNPDPDQVRQLAAYLLDRGPAPQPRHTPKAAAAQSQTRSSASSTHPITVDIASFDRQVLRSDIPVLVDFWAAWCGPCRMIAPTLEKLAGEYGGRIKIAKLNVEENAQLAARYNAQSIPLLVLFKNGKPVNQLLGAHPESNIRKLIEQALR